MFPGQDWQFTAHAGIKHGMPLIACHACMVLYSVHTIKDRLGGHSLQYDHYTI